MPNIADFATPDGKTDIAAYNAAFAAERKRDIDTGRYCYRCRSYIVFGNKGYRQLCYDCEKMDRETGEVTTTHAIRCPKCRHHMTIAENELYDLYNEGEHDVSCTSCGHDFTVSTRVSYSFESPALLDADDEEDEEEENESDEEEDEDTDETDGKN